MLRPAVSPDVLREVVLMAMNEEVAAEPASHCRLVSSGSLGVELGLRALNVGSGDRVAVCGYDYPGNLRAIESIGARPLLIDADPTGYSLDPDQLNKLNPADIKAVVVSHLYGIPADVEAIGRICKQNNWQWIEDACQTPLMPISGRFAGSHGSLGVLSFGGSKPLTAGNGGAIVTSDVRIASKLNALLDRPSDAAPVSPLQAAALLPQLCRLHLCNLRRAQTIARLVDEVSWLSDSMLGVCPPPDATCYKLAFLSHCRDSLLAELHEAGIPAGDGFRSMHRSSRRRCDRIGELRRCEQLGEQVCLIDHRALLANNAAQDQLVQCLQRIRLT
ncbi:DegT/DnrJ/EryC1/StrS family aminotransferase [Roseiconus lacunae]|uniref:DegT/DnrJ/EryC1/StrS family aminotransferase n=1 Tax=Roseiconus lacunae TaxID=2605694 RepID=UPI003084C4DB|nr:DegT/DnrJ/EryC1/StrS family aminotransferase [Stieleria sp. HD01]